MGPNPSGLQSDGHLALSGGCPILLARAHLEGHIWQVPIDTAKWRKAQIEKVPLPDQDTNLHAVGTWLSLQLASCRCPVAHCARGGAFGWLEAVHSKTTASAAV